MREILFRGKCVDSGEWVEGWLMNERIIPKGQEFTVECRNPQYFVDTDKLELYEITPSTICQYTGLTDKNGTKIFEGDICKTCICKSDMSEEDVVGKIYFRDGAFEFVCEYGDIYVSDILDASEVIGNIYDNPELMRGAENE